MTGAGANCTEQAGLDIVLPRSAHARAWRTAGADDGILAFESNIDGAWDLACPNATWAIRGPNSTR